MQKVEGQSSRMVWNDNGNKRNDFSKQWRITTGLRRLRSLAQNRLFLPLSLPFAHLQVWSISLPLLLVIQSSKMCTIFCLIFIYIFCIKFNWTENCKNLKSILSKYIKLHFDWIWLFSFICIVHVSFDSYLLLLK